LEDLLGVLIVGFLGLGNFAKAETKTETPRFKRIIGTSSFNAKLEGTSGAYISPFAAIEVLYPYKNIEYGANLKLYFVNEITLGFLPVIKYNLSKAFYLKTGAGLEISGLLNAGRAVYHKDYFEGCKELWVGPCKKPGMNWFVTIGVQGNSGLGIETGIEYRKLKSQWKVDDAVKEEKTMSKLGILVRLIF